MWLLIFGAASLRCFAQDAPPDPTTAMVLEPDPTPSGGNGEGTPGRGSRGGSNGPSAPAPDTGTSGVDPVDANNPIGVTGIFNGNSTTAGGYDPLTHSAHRAIDDIVVPGSIGKYPLKMTRYFTSRSFPAGLLGPGWRHEYMWSSLTTGLFYPNGNQWGSACFDPVGVSDRWETAGFRLADGGTVVFGGPGGAASAIIDPFGQTTTLTYNASNLLDRVTDPGGRYLQFLYSADHLLLTRVEAHMWANTSASAWVNYTYTSVSPGNGGASVKCLTRVDYSDGTAATYTYREDNKTWDTTGLKIWPLLETCDDVRYEGAMRQIKYEYYTGDQSIAHGEIYREKCYTTGAAVATIAPELTAAAPNANVFTETRGDGPTRTFTYTAKPGVLQDPQEGCPTFLGNPDNGQQFLVSFTDFQNHTTYIGYDANWYINSVKDANNHTTSYVRGAPPNGIGEITQITHPDSKYIQYIYTTGDPHYVATIIDERGNKTVHTRDTNHRITRTDYKDSSDVVLAFEEFTYNSFGQVLTHHLKNGNYIHYQYDTRGLLTAKTVPTSNPYHDSSLTWDPKTTYTYYNAGGGWTDRLQTATRPANVSNQIATETYEYDRNTSGAAVGGRGVITKITHAINQAGSTYQSASWSQYGNKIWEENELRQRTSYTYDDYNRVLTVNREMGSATDEITTSTYAPTNGTGTSPYLHTTSNPDTVTTPTGIVTKYDYDENYRKVSTTEAPNTSVVGTTQFGYDNVGNLTSVTDPNGHITANVYDTRNRKTDETRASGTSNAKTTSYTYDEASNITVITRPDLTTELKSYDGLNRLYLHMVPFRTTNGVTQYNGTNFTYNPSGTIHTITDPNGHVTTFEYDESDRRTKMTYHDSSYQTWAWDAVGNLASRITVGGQTQSFGYDNRNRKTSMLWSNSVEWQWFQYDAASRLTIAQNGYGTWGTNLVSTVTREYDAAGRLTLDRQAPAGATSMDVTYGYDLDGKVTRTTVELNSYSHTYSYDARGRLDVISDGLTGLWQFQYLYDAASNKTYFSNWINGVYEHYIYNALDWITQRDVIRDPNTLASETYNHNPLGQVTLIDRTGTNDDRFGYYLDGELNWATYDTTALNDVTYTLDRAGNRISIVDGGVNKSYTATGINQYTTANGVSVTNGSAEHQISAFNGITLEYMNDGQLSKVSNGTHWINFYYDALGRCVKRLTDGWAVYYSYYDGEKELLECGSGGGAAYRNVYGKGVDEILMRQDTTRAVTYYYQRDQNGNITHLTDGGGTVIEKYQYDAFGAPAFFNGSGGVISGTAYYNPLLFTGRRYQSDYGIYEYRARAYHPKLGRFTSEDPKLFDAADYNLFRYCHNDPEDLTDPMGLAPDIMHNQGNMTPEQYAYLMSAVQRAVMDQNFSAGAIGIGMADITTAQLHGTVMNYREAAGLYPSIPRTIIEGPGPVRIDVDGRGPTHGDPKANKDHETSYKRDGKSLNADKDNYVVRSPSSRREGVRLGDRAIFSANEKLVHAIVGDSGHPGIEASLHAVHAAGIPTIDRPNFGPVPATPRGRDVNGTVIYYPSRQPEE
jgi:RHS repeat-associated protein